MTLEDDIKETFSSDTESILRECMDDLEGMFQFLEDGTIDILGKYRDAGYKNRFLIHLIAKRYQYESNSVETPALNYDFFYRVFGDISNDTVRGYMKDLRDGGLVTKTEDGHEIIVERLRDAIDRIESEFD